MSRAHRVGLVGHGIGASLSPAMHEREARRLGLDYTYDVIDLAERPDVDLGHVLDELESDGYDAVNVTHPFKTAAVQHGGEPSAAVARIGATNLVLFGPSGRTCHNTDHSGFRDALSSFLEGRPGGTVVQVGAGGAGAATGDALVDLGVEYLVVHDEDHDAAAGLVHRLAAQGHAHVESTGGVVAPWWPRAGGVVHATPVGMRGHPGTAVAVDRLDPATWVAEVVYRPVETELVRQARDRGLRVLDGRAMAAGQAADSLRLITGLEPDVAMLHAHLEELTADERR